MRKGLVSVIMGVHNERSDYLNMAVESICNQTYKQLEFIIIDDCSNDECAAQLNGLAKKFEIIKLVHNSVNLGLTRSLNIGLGLAEGEYVARMDADDFSVPTRIEKQVNYLCKHPDIDILGTGVISFGDKSEFFSPAFGQDNDGVQCTLFFSSALCHPSVMMRKSFLAEYELKYDENVKKGQDYDMWERCSVYGKLAVMKDILLYYRCHSEQITSKERGSQDLTREIVMKRRLSRLGIIPNDREFLMHTLLAFGTSSEISVLDIEGWIDKLLNHNSSCGLVSSRFFEKDLYYRLLLFKLRNRRFSSLNFIDVCRGTLLLFSRMGIKFRLLFNSFDRI